MTSSTRFPHPRIDAAGVALALAIAGAGFWFGVRPVLHSEEDSRRLAGQMTASQAQLETARTEYRQLQDAIADAREQLEAMAISLDESDQLAARQAGIGRVFRASGIEIEQFTVGSIQPGELLDVVPLRISGKGASPDVIAVMHSLRRRYPDLAVTAFQIASGGADGQIVTFGFDVTWYVASDDSAGG